MATSRHNFLNLDAIALFATADGTDAPLLLGAAVHPRVGYFRRFSMRRDLLVCGHLAAQLVPPNARRSVTHAGCLYHVIDRDGLMGIFTADASWPSEAVFESIAFFVQRFAATHKERWCRFGADCDETVAVLKTFLQRCQNLPDADAQGHFKNDLLADCLRTQLDKEVRWTLAEGAKFR